MTHTPKLRFPEFADKWEVNKLGEIVDSKSKKFNPEKEKESTKCIELEHLATESGQLLGYVEGQNSGSIKNKFDKGDVLFGKLRPYLKKYLKAPFDGVCSSEIWVLKGKNLSNDFLYFVVQTNTFIDLANISSGSKMPRADWNVVADGSFSIPQLPEQTKIANFLTAIDEKVQALKQKKTLLEQYKKGIMQQIFSQERNTARLRFKNDDGADFDDWEEKSLGEITYKTDKKNKEKEVLPVYSISNKNGFVHQSEQFDGVDSVERGYDTSLYKIVESNTFAYNPARINVGSIGYSGNLERVLVSSLYVCFKTINVVDDLFFSYFLKTKYFNDSVNRSSEGGIRVYLFYENFSQIKINLPTFPEQQKIANFLSAIDEKIEKASQQISGTETYKKGLLQQMFC
jgi:type I restriction enzyme S subunit